MPKLQSTLPSSLGEVVGRVQVKTRAKALAIEYLIYLARAEPSFPKKTYAGDRNTNCTLSVDDEIYSSHFDGYREDRSPPLTTQRAFFEDALTRGASMYDAGYRLSAPRMPSDAILQASSDWLDLADRVGAVADVITTENGDFDAHKIGRREGPTSAAVGLLLIRLFGTPAENPRSKSPTAKQVLEEQLGRFAAARQTSQRRKLGVAILASLKSANGRPLGIENWDELAGTGAHGDS